MTEFAFLDQAEPIAFAHRGGAGRLAREHDAGLRRGRGPRLPLRRDRRARHRRRRAVRVPRRAPRPGHRPHRADPRAAVVRGRPGPGSTAPSPSRGSTTCSTPGPTCGSTSTPSTTRRSTPWPPRCAATGAVDRVCIGAFSDRRLARLRNLLGPDGCARRWARAAWPACGPPASAPRPAGCTRRACRCRRRRAGSPSSTPGSCAAAHRRGLPVHVWTIDDPAEMDRLLDLGVDGIMTDRPPC